MDAMANLIQQMDASSWTKQKIHPFAQKNNREKIRKRGRNND